MLKIRSSQAIDVQKAPKFYDIKQLQYFKQIIRRVQDPHLKQILPSYIIKVLTKDLDHNNFIYVPDRAVDECNAGYVIDESVSWLSKKVWLYRLDKKVDQIFRNILNVQMPVLKELRISDRFAVLSESIIENYAFNRTVYRKGQQFIGIYFVIEGEVKIMYDKACNPVKLVSKHNYLGLEQLQKQQPNYINMVVSNCNGTQLLFISTESINKLRENSQLTLKQLFGAFHENEQEGVIIMEDVSKIRERSQLQSRKINRTPLELNTFVRKCDQFMKVVNKTDKGFNDYLKSKKILLQLRESMTAAKISRRNTQSRQFRILKMDELLYKSPKLNTNILTCRSELLKQNILKRLEISKNCSKMEPVQQFSQSIPIQCIPMKR